MQRHPAVAVGERAAHFGAAEAATAAHADALGARLLHGLHGPLHGTAERHTTSELVGDALRDQRGVELGLRDLADVELHLGVVRDLDQRLAQAIGFGATATDDDAGTRRVQVDAQAVTRALDFDAADRGALELLAQVVADLPVLDDVVLVLTIGEPAALPISGDAETEPVRIDLLSHYSASFLLRLAGASASAGASSTRRFCFDRDCFDGGFGCFFCESGCLR